MAERDEMLDSERYNHFVCPNCGGEVRVGSPSCPHCGSDERTGWAEDADAAGDFEGGYGGDDSFDYDSYIAREFNEGPGVRKGRMRQLVVAGAVCILVVALVVVFVIS